MDCKPKELPDIPLLRTLLDLLRMVVVVITLFQPCLGLANEHEGLIEPNRNFVLSEQEAQFIHSLAPLRVMIDDNFVPLSFYDTKTGSFQGLSVDLFRHLADRLGLKYKLLHNSKLSWSDKVELFKNRQIDLLMPVSFTEERATAGIFTNSFYETYYGAIVKKTKNIRIKNTHDLALYKVGATNASAIIPFMQSSVPSARITYYKNQNDLYQAVRNGEVDVALQNRNVFQDDRFNHGFVDLIMTHTIVEYPRKYAYYLNRTEPYNKLAAIMDRYLVGADYSRLVSNYERSEDELILRYNEQKHQTKLLVFGAIGSSLLLVMLSIVYLNHRRFSAKLAASLEQVQHQKVRLQQSEKKYRDLFDHSRDALMTLEPPAWKFTSGNQATVDMFRAKDEEDFIFHGPWDLSPERQPDGSASIEKSREMIENALRHGFHFFEWTHQRIGGEEFPADVLLTRIDEDREKVVLQATVRDITDRKRAEEDRAKLEAQLQQAQKMESVGLLAGGVAHDFNNLLTIILLNTHLALMKSDQTQPVNEHLMSIENAAKNSADLTRQLLAFARKQIIAPTVLDLNAVVPDMIKMLKRLIGENIDLHWQPAADLWPVKMDLSQIVQIMANLCVNARDSITGVGKITIETANCCLDEHNCFATAEYEYVQIVVSDTGCGMDKEIQNHIFEPFFTTKGVGKGTGLGLATVYGIVKQNNGFIYVSSELGTGTTFKIYIPRYLGKVEQASKKGAQKPDPHGQETILLVEDEEDILDIATIILEKLGYTVLAANSPSEAIRLMKEHASGIQLLITDVIMPEENGMDLSKKLLCLHPQLKCLFMSGYTADIIANHGVLDEGLHFIQKPLTLPALATKVREVLDN